MSLSEKLIAAAKSGNAREVRKLLGRGALFTKDQYGNTALHEAAWNGNNDIVKILLGSFCFVDSINHTGFTPLHLASQNGHPKVVKTLLKWRADPTLRNQHGETALHLMAKYDHASVVSAFAFFKIHLDIRGKDENTALHIAATLGNRDVIKALLQCGADPSLTNSIGLLPWQCAENAEYKDVAKLLQPSTKRGRPRASTETKTRLRSRSKTPDREVHDSVKLQRSVSTSVKFPFRPAKDVWAAVGKKKKKNSSPLDESYRAQSGHHSGLNASREELDGDYDYPTSPSQTKAASIDQLLSEIEHEFYGPDYKYTPRESSLSPADYGDSLSCPTDTTDSPLHVPAKNFLRSTRDGEISMENYDILEAPGPNDHYDFLLPPSPPTSKPPTKETTPKDTSSKDTSSSVKDTSSSVKDKRYEGLLPRRGTKDSLEEADADTYVYMAPWKDFQRSSSVPVESSSDSLLDSSSTSNSESSQSRAKSSKRAIICSSPVHVKATHEPNSSLEPAKGILSQPSTDSEQHSHLERYLEDELETMRQAFQIRLSQLEKRYQRQLVLEKRRNSHSPIQPRRLSRKMNPLSPLGYQNGSTIAPSRVRRNSWHSTLSDEEELDKLVRNEKRSGSLQRAESDCSIDESDLEPDRRRSSRRVRCDQVAPDTYGNKRGELPAELSRGHLRGPGQNPPQQSSTPKPKLGLKGGARSWREERNESNSPRMSPVGGFYDDDDAPSEAAKALIQAKVRTHHGKMVTYIQEKAEAKIASIEDQYRRQMGEVERKCEQRATQQLTHLASRIKDLECRLEVQTLV